MSVLILEGKNLKVMRGGLTILDVPDICLYEGGVLSLIGPNGAGKTTLLLTLAALNAPFSGELFFRGTPVTDSGAYFDYRRKISAVFQEPLLFSGTVSSNVASGLRMRGLPPKDTERIVRINLELMRITHLAGRNVRTLSAGEANRTSLARALAVNPDILFLDEPFSAVDPLTREILIDELASVLREKRITTVFATHDRNEALRLGSRLAVMMGGSIRQIGDPQEIFNAPTDEDVANFVGVETILDGVVSEIKDGTFTAHLNGQTIYAVGKVGSRDRVILCIRPENVGISLGNPSAQGSPRNVFSGRITEIKQKGLFYCVTVNCGFLISSFVTGNAMKELGLTEQKSVFVSFKATAVHTIRL